MRTWRAIILIAVIVGAYFLARIEINQNKTKTASLDKLNLVLTGIIESIDLPESSNGFGIVQAKIVNSNVVFYLPANDEDYYYCRIKDGIAEFYQYGATDCRIGDTVNVDTRQRKFIVKRNGRIFEKEIIVYNNPAFFRYVKEHSHE